MSRVKVVRDSKFRQLIVESRDVYREISPLDSPGDIISSSKDKVAFATSSNDIQILPVSDIKEPKISLKGHGSGPILDLSFSSLNFDLLASAGSDSCVKIWKLNENIGEQEQASLDNGTGKGVNQVRWHSTCASLLATSSGNLCKVWDVENPTKELFTVTCGKDISSINWNWIGNKIAICSPTDKSIQIGDPREFSRSSMTIANCHSGGKFINCEWASPNEYLLFTCGQSFSKDRELCVYDIRKPTTSLNRNRIDNSSGSLRPLFDVDTGLLYLLGRGDSNIRIFECTTGASSSSSEGELFPIGNYIFKEPARASCLLSKSGCDIMNCEIDRIFRLLSNQIESVKVEVPRRRTGKDFQNDIFPDTKLPKETLSVSEYKGKQNATPLLGNIEILAGLRSESIKKDPTSVTKEEEEELKKKAEEEERVNKEHAERLAQKNSELDQRFSKFLGYQPKMKFAKVSQSKRDDSLYNLLPETGTSDSINIACSTEFYALPWKGNTGPVFVSKFSKIGKMANPTNAPVLLGHSSTVNCLAFDEFDPYVLATGADDCHIRIWRIPENGINSTADASKCLDSSIKLEGGHRLSVRGVNFHPTAKDILSSFGSDPSVKIWDINTGKCAIELDETLLGSAAAGNTDWNYDGSQIGISGKDAVVRIVDPRKKEISLQFQAHEGLKGSRLAWLGQENAMVTTGFGKTGDRQFKIWDLRNHTKPLSSTPLDAGAGVMIPYFVEDNGVLLLYAKGELTFRIYELEGLSLIQETDKNRKIQKFDLHKCTEFRATGEPTAGIAFLPRRNVNVENAEWLRGVRLTPTLVETLSFTIPRSTDVKGFFYDDIYPSARSSTPVFGQAQHWLNKENEDEGPKRIDLNTKNLKKVSERPPEEAHATMKKGAASVDKMKKSLEEQERKKREAQEAMDRIQQLAIQHEKFNPNLSKTSKGADEVADDEWGD